MTGDTQTNDAHGLPASIAEEVASRARFRLYLGGGCGQLLSLSLIVACGIYCHFVPNHNLLADGVAFGISMSIVNLAALWSALGPMRLFTRVPLAILLVAATSLALILYCALDDVDDDIQISIVLLLVPSMMAAQFAGTSACFLLPGRALNRRVGLAVGDPPKQHSDAQFGIGHLLLWTTGIALLVGGFRLAVLRLAPHGLKEIALPISDILLQVVIFLFFNVVLALPIPWAVLSGGRLWIRVAVAFAIIGVAIGVQHVVYSSRLVGADGPGLLYLAVQDLSAALLLTVNLLIVRLCGFRLVPGTRLAR